MPAGPEERRFRRRSPTQARRLTVIDAEDFDARKVDADEDELELALSLAVAASRFRLIDSRCHG